MNSLVMLAGLLVASAVNAQQPSPTPPAQQPPPVEQSQQKIESHKGKFFKSVGDNSIFIYSANTEPCGPLPPIGTILLPLGSGFVLQIPKKGSPPIGTTAAPMQGWSFVFTAKHVIANQTAIIVRVNAQDHSKFICQKIELNQNVLAADDGVDLVAFYLPEIKGYLPATIPTNLLVNQKQIEEWSIGVGTEVVTVGYLFGYSGQKSNYPVAKFGHISMISDESWYRNPESHLMEQGYILDLSNVPGLSGSPVFTYGTEVEVNPIQFRELQPFLIGVVKGLMLAPAGDAKISEGVAVIEPGSHVKELMQKIALILKAQGGDVEPIN
jgi:hypothetical protein